MNFDQSIPNGLKRQIQRRCGYGCIICGHPICRYERTEQPNSNEHTSANTVLLCAAHSVNRAEGQLTAAELSAAHAKPHNVNSEVSAPYGFHYEGDDQKLVLGENIFTNHIAEADTAVVPLLIDGAGIIGLMIENNKVFLNINIFDTDDRLILKVEENELIMMPEGWDITFADQKLTVTEHDEVILTLDFSIPGTVVIEQAEIRCRGIRVRIRDGVMAVLNNKRIIRNAHFDDAPVAVSLGDSPDPDLHGAVNITDIERSGIDWDERDLWFRHETMWF